MPLYINSNISSLNARRHLNKSNGSLARSFERLSSGLRINSAADDAAGLAISSRMGAQVRSLNTAIRNGNDGISLVQTAEAAMNEASNVLSRMRELAVQAANDTNTNADRASLQTEVSQLIDELNRIGNQTEFNTISLLDGSYSDQTFHIGFKAGQTLAVSIDDMRATALGARAFATASSAVNASAFTAGDVVINGTSIGASSSGDDSLSTTQASASAIAKAAAINAQTGLTNVSAEVVAATTATAAVTATALSAGELVINGIDIGAVNNVAALDAGGVLTAAINAKTSATGVTATLDATAGTISLTTADGRNIHFSTSGQGAALFANGTVTRSSIKLTSDDDFVLGGPASSSRLGISPTLYTEDFTDVVSTINISTRSGANDSLAVLDAAIDTIAKERSDLGAVQNRLESTLTNLEAVSENLSAARSRIMDADFASETADLTRAQIIQQAGVSILAQANTAPQAVLSLLGG